MELDYESHRKLLSLVESSTRSTGMRIEHAAVCQLKSLCRASPQNLRAAFEIVAADQIARTSPSNPRSGAAVGRFAVLSFRRFSPLDDRLSDRTDRSDDRSARRRFDSRAGGHA
eukprot:897652_1